MTSTLEDACDQLKSDKWVNIGYLLEDPTHIIYWPTFRDGDWRHFMKDYWVFNTMDRYPATAHVLFLIDRVLQSARDPTLAIRLKNDLVTSEGDKVNEVLLVRKTGDRFFHGAEIGHIDDIPMWAAVHSISYYRATSSLVARILRNRNQQIEFIIPRMMDNDAVALEGLMRQCAQKLPEIRSHQRRVGTSISLRSWNEGVISHKIVMPDF